MTGGEHPDGEHAAGEHVASEHATVLSGTGGVWQVLTAGGERREVSLRGRLKKADTGRRADGSIIRDTVRAAADVVKLAVGDDVVLEADDQVAGSRRPHRRRLTGQLIPPTNERSNAMTTASYTVQGMTCSHCVVAVTSEISAIDGVTGVDVDLASGAVAVTTSKELDRVDVRAAVEEAGYVLSE